MAEGEVTISELELADEVLGDMVLAVDTTSDTKSVSLRQLKAWLGSSLPTGFIIPAVGRISDERFTLLDGKTLARDGTYQAFCNKVVEQVQAGNWFACTAQEYEADLTNHGQCGRFVITNDYVRIPLITRYIGATVTLSEIGRTYAESLPNITGGLYNTSDSTLQDVGLDNGVASGAISIVTDTVNKMSNQNTDEFYNQNKGWELNASRSSSTYQDNAKVNPEHTKYPYYMVVSIEGQTSPVEIDINEVYEDLNLKANTDLSNVPNSKGILVESYQNGTSWYRVYSDGWCEQGGITTSSTDIDKTTTYLKAFTDNDYTLLVTTLSSETIAYSQIAHVGAKSKTSTDFVTRVSPTLNKCWYACGYIS